MTGREGSLRNEVEDEPCGAAGVILNEDERGRVWREHRKRERERETKREREREKREREGCLM